MLNSSMENELLINDKWNNSDIFAHFQSNHKVIWPLFKSTVNHWLVITFFFYKNIYSNIKDEKTKIQFHFLFIIDFKWYCCVSLNLSQVVKLVRTIFLFTKKTTNHYIYTNSTSRQCSCNKNWNILNTHKKHILVV